ncbi:SRPBCC family protein [Ectobacillus ponti]|uniref:SRPBCC family protein n=1 Tax=Ectobacillus ponti TaxID=2961894 RepID=A0AA42BR55_9BACI|nr:SRPBCC family protein [Ectobacillus ponti]MCP8967063.1 SRPBCC family protein [Ectobacillus ponti]
MKREYEIMIAAPAAGVFQWLTDGERMKKWMDGLESFTYERKGDFLEGAAFQQTMRLPVSQVTWNGTVTSYRENEELGLSLQAPMFSLQLRYVLHEHRGQTLLQQQCHMQTSAWMGVMLPMVSAFCDMLFQQQLQKLKTCVERA